MYDGLADSQSFLDILARPGRTMPNCSPLPCAPLAQAQMQRVYPADP